MRMVLRALWRTLPIAIITGVAAWWLVRLRLDPNTTSTLDRILTIAAIAWPTARIALADIKRGYSDYRIDRDLKLRRKVHTVLCSLFLGVIKRPDVMPEDIGVSAYLVRRTGSRGLRPQLHRVGAVRLGTPITTSGVAWTRGKGVIGRCWARGAVEFAETRVAWGPHIDCDKKHWDALDEDTRLGLPHKDFQRLRGKYRAAVAVPIHRGKVTIGVPAAAYGVVALDITYDGKTPVKALEDPVVLDLLSSAAAAVADYAGFLDDDPADETPQIGEE